jgi:3-deoxy-D-manno-octulosonic-acid transferase
VRATFKSSTLAAVTFATYRLIARAATPLVLRHIERRRRRGKEHAERWRERLGWPGAARPAGRLVWLHGASVGEALSALPLIERLAAAGVTVLVTTGTVTSAALMSERLPAGVTHQFVPVDLPGPVEQFLDHWRPDLVLWLESELWPTMLTGLRRRGIPAALVNGRLSPASFRAWSWAPWAARFLLSGFALVLAQSAADAERFARLGASGVRHVGNLKFAGVPLGCSEAALAEIAASLGPRPRWLAASTHEGEEAAAAAAHATLVRKHPGLVTLIVPRHPERGPAICRALAAAGHAVRLRSEDAALPPAAGIYIADTLGELGLWFRAADLVFLGKSLAASGPQAGGHNPLEPARLGAALLFGPGMDSFAEIAADLLAAGAARRVAGAADLAAHLDTLLGDGQLRRDMGGRARRYAEGGETIADAVMTALEPLLVPLTSRVS